MIKVTEGVDDSVPPPTPLSPSLASLVVEDKKINQTLRLLTLDINTFSIYHTSE